MYEYMISLSFTHQQTLVIIKLPANVEGYNRGQKKWLAFLSTNVSFMRYLLPKMVTVTEIAHQNDIYMVWLLLGELLTQQQEE